MFCAIITPYTPDAERNTHIDKEKKKLNLGALANSAGKNAISFLGKTKDTIVKAADQNNDGSFDLKDVSAIAGSIGAAAKNATATAINNAAEIRREKDLKALQPLFPDDISASDFALSKLIRIADPDKKHAENEVCIGSIGYIASQKDLNIVNIFKNEAARFDLELIPDGDCEVYYVDPINPHKYIALDEYFNHLKIERVNELQRIAQALGAKHFRVVYKEQQSSFADTSAKYKAVAKVAGKGGTAEAEHSSTTATASTVEVAAEMYCAGHAPVMPTLTYLQKDSSVQNLIALRMDPASPITQHKFTLKLSNSSGIKAHDAEKIDAALKVMKTSATRSITSEVRKESCRFLEYEIEF